MKQNPESRIGITIPATQPKTNIVTDQSTNFQKELIGVIVKQDPSTTESYQQSNAYPGVSRKPYY